MKISLSTAPAPVPSPLWNLPGIAANSDVELTALEAAKRLGWRGIVGAGTEAAAEGIGATLWGIARIGLPILTLGLVMEGDESPRPLRLGDFPPAQPDPQWIVEQDLAFLKQQKTLAELSGNTSLAQLLNVRIQQLTPSVQNDLHIPINRTLTGGLNMIANASGGDSTTILPPAMSVEEEVARARLKAANPALQWSGWRDLYNLNPEAARQITQADLGPAAPFVAGTQGVAKYVIRGSQAWERAASEIYAMINAHQRNQPYPTFLDIHSLQPSHSLMDFMPAPYSQGFMHDPIMQRYFNSLQTLRQDRSLTPAQILELFIGGNYSIYITQLLSGLYIVRDGHHRLAALVKAAREGVIPSECLQQVPVDLSLLNQDFPIPEPVILQIYAPAHTLPLDELLPPP